MFKEWGVGSCVIHSFKKPAVLQKHHLNQAQGVPLHGVTILIQMERVESQADLWEENRWLGPHGDNQGNTVGLGFCIFLTWMFKCSNNNNNNNDNNINNIAILIAIN